MEQKIIIKEKNNDWKNICILTVICLLAFLAYFIAPYEIRHDTSYHYTNIFELKEQILNNGLFNIQNNIVGDIANNLGYGTRIFYPPVSHYSVAIIDLPIDNLEVSLKIYSFLAVLISGITMYYCTKKISKNLNVSLFASVIYMLYSYHLSEVFIRDAIGELLIFIFVPLIANSIYDLLILNGKRFYILFITGFVGMILSHANMTLYLAVLLGGFLVLNLKSTLKKENLTKLATGTVLTLLLTAFFWIPMVEVKIVGDYRVFEEGVMVQGTTGNGLNPLRYIYPQISDMETKPKYYVDIFVIYLIVHIVISKIKQRFEFGKMKNIEEKIDSKFFKAGIWVGILAIWMSTNLFMWDLLPKSLRIIQFPWRMATYSAFFISIVAAYAVKELKNKKMYYIILMVVSLSCILELNTQLITQEKYLFVNAKTIIEGKLSGKEVDEEIKWNTPEKEKKIDYINAMGWQKEYLSTSAYDNFEYVSSRTQDILNTEDTNIDVLISENSVPKIDFEIETSGVYEFPRLFYPGYVIRDQYNNKIEVYENEKGLVEASLGEGKYILNYEGTLVLKTGYAITIFTTLLITIYNIKNMRKKKLRK